MSYELPKKQFEEEQDQGVRRLSDNAIIPFDESNIDYQEYLAWVDAGNTAPRES
jgi:hypothetical protein